MMKYFVPVTDEMLEQVRDVNQLVPFTHDVPCYHWLEYEILTDEEMQQKTVVEEESYVA